MDESAMIDGCTQFQAFRYVIVPVMWPGVITTGLFSFLLAYNDYAVTSMLLSKPNETMVPAVASFLGTVQVQGNIMYAVAAVVSSTIPLFLLILFIIFGKSKSNFFSLIINIIFFIFFTNLCFNPRIIWLYSSEDYQVNKLQLWKHCTVDTAIHSNIINY